MTTGTYINYMFLHKIKGQSSLNLKLIHYHIDVPSQFI